MKFCLTADSKLLPAFEACTHFTVNVLAEKQIDISRRFAGTRHDKFSGLDLRVGAGETKAKAETTMQQGGRAKDALGTVACGDTPLIAGCCATFECRRETQHADGDHVIFIGYVERHHRNKDAPAPLLYCGGHYRTMPPQA